MNCIALKEMAMWQLSVEGKLCSLIFDEIPMNKTYTYNEELDIINAPKTNVLIVMVKGLTQNWMHPNYLKYDTAITTTILFNIMDKLYKLQFVVKTIVSDMIASNNKLRNKLRINTDKPYFLHPSDEKCKVYVFYDPIHAVNSIRTNFINNGFFYNNKIINKKSIIKLINSKTSFVNKSILNYPL